MLPIIKKGRQNVVLFYLTSLLTELVQTSAFLVRLCTRLQFAVILRRQWFLFQSTNQLSDRNYRIVFETDGKRVLRFRAGKLPEVEYIEGCS